MLLVLVKQPEVLWTNLGHSPLPYFMWIVHDAEFLPILSSSFVRVANWTFKLKRADKTANLELAKMTGKLKMKSCKNFKQAMKGYRGNKIEAIRWLWSIQAIGFQTVAKPRHWKMAISICLWGEFEFTGSLVYARAIYVTVIKVSVNTQMTFTFIKICPKRQNLLLGLPWAMGHVQNSRSGCKYTSSFSTLMETLTVLMIRLNAFKNSLPTVLELNYFDRQWHWLTALYWQLMIRFSVFDFMLNITGEG